MIMKVCCINNKFYELFKVFVRNWTDNFYYIFKYLTNFYIVKCWLNEYHMINFHTSHVSITLYKVDIKLKNIFNCNFRRYIIIQISNRFPLIHTELLIDQYLRCYFSKLPIEIAVLEDNAFLAFTVKCHIIIIKIIILLCGHKQPDIRVYDLTNILSLNLQ